LDIRRLQRCGALQSGSQGSWAWTDTHTGEQRGSVSYETVNGRFTLRYTIDGSPRAQTISIEKSACNFGGMRPWFCCPVRGERVAMLFLRAGRFACRDCQRLAYGSQSQDALGRTWRRQSKLEERLGPYHAKPKGMHGTTYKRLLSAIFDCEEQRDAALSVFMDRLVARYPSLRADFDKWR
jgi:hypothetical protein